MRINKEKSKELAKITKFISMKVNTLRIKRKIKKVEISEQLGYSRNAATDMLQGESGFTPRTLYLLCHILKCDILDIFPSQKVFSIKKKVVGKSGEFRIKYELKIK